MTSSASRSISWNESTMIRPTPSSTARASSAEGLVVAVEADPLHREARPLRDGELAAGADVEAESLLGDPAGDRRAEERLAGVEDVAVGEPVAEGPGPGPEVLPRRGRTPGSRARPTRSVRRTPPTSSAPSTLRAVCDHSSGTSALGSPGSRSHDGPRRAPARVRPAGLVGLIGRSHPLRCARRRAGRGRSRRRSRGASTSSSRARCRSVELLVAHAAAPGSRRRTCGRSPRSSSR